MLTRIISEKKERKEEEEENEKDREKEKKNYVEIVPPVQMEAYEWPQWSIGQKQDWWHRLQYKHSHTHTHMGAHI